MRAPSLFMPRQSVSARGAGPLVLACALLAGTAGCPRQPVRNPKVSATRYKLGHDYFRRAMKAKTAAARERFVNVALTELQRSVKADEQNHHAHFLLGILYLYKGQRALDEAQVAQCARGAERKEYLAEADRLMKRAWDHFLRTYRLRKERDSRSALNLSTVALHFRRYQEAERYARAALSNIAYATPHLARANIGRAQFERGKLRKALKNLKQSVFSEPRFCAGHYWLGRVLFALKKFEPAARSFQVALACCAKERIPPIVEAQLYEGLAMMRLGRHQEALVALGKCVKQAPSSCAAARCKASLATVAGSK